MELLHSNKTFKYVNNILLNNDNQCMGICVQQMNSTFFMSEHGALYHWMGICIQIIEINIGIFSAELGICYDVISIVLVIYVAVGNT